MGKVYLNTMIVRDRYEFDKENLVPTGRFLEREEYGEKYVTVEESDWNGEYVAKLFYDMLREYASNDEDALTRVGSVFEIEQYEDASGRFVPNDQLKDVAYDVRYAMFVSVVDENREMIEGDEDGKMTLAKLSHLNLSTQSYIVTFDNEDDHEKFAYESDLDMN